MAESLVDTYARLKRNIAEAKAKVEKDPSIKNMEWLRLMTDIYYDFCATFTEQMIKSMAIITDEVRYM